MKKNKLCVMLGTVCLTMAALVGCGSKNEAPAEPQVQETEAETETETVEDVSDEDVFNAQAKMEFQKLFEEAIKCCEDYDIDGFYALYRDGEEDQDQIDLDYSYLSESFIPAMYENTRYSVIGGDGTYFMGYIENYETEGTYPDATSTSNHLTVSLSYVNGEWKFDDSEAAAKAAEAYSASIYPEEMVMAKEKSLNTVDLSDSDYSWTESTSVLPDEVIGKVYLAWENSDGSISILLNVKNGTSTDKTVDSATIYMTDSMLGELFTTTWEGQTVKANTAENFIINIPVDEQTETTDVWVDLNANTTLNFR